MTLHDLNSSSLPSEITKYENDVNNGKWIIRYHADWCGHCQVMKPEWKKFTDNHKQFNIASLEENAIDKLKTKPSNLLGFPSIHLNNNGKFIKEFSGKRESADFKNFYDSYAKHTGGGKHNKKVIKRKGSSKKILRKKTKTTFRKIKNHSKSNKH